MAARCDAYAGMRLIEVEAGRRITLPPDAVRTLGVRAGDRVLVLRSGPGLVLIKEDRRRRRMVEHNGYSSARRRPSRMFRARFAGTVGQRIQRSHAAMAT